MATTVVKLGRACVVVVALGLAACSGSDGVERDVAAASPAPVRTTFDAQRDAAELRPSDRVVEATWAADADPVRGVPQSAAVMDVLPDGRVLEVLTNQTTSWKLGDPMSIAMYDPTSRVTTVLVSDDERTPGTVVNGAAVVSDQVVWTDSGGRYSDPWTLRTKNLTTGTVSTLAEAPTVPDGEPGLVFPGAYPLIHDGIVYLAGDSGENDRDGEPVPSLFRVPIDGSGELEEYLRGADQPRLSGSTLMYRTAGRVHSRDLDGVVADGVIDARWTGPAAESWTYAEGTFASAYPAADGTYSVHVVPAEGPAVDIVRIKQKPGPLRATSRWVDVVAGGGGTDDPQANYLLDLANATLRTIEPDHYYLPAEGSGGRFVLGSREGSSADRHHPITYTLASLP